MVRLLRSDRPRARNYFSRREQLRLLFLAAAVVVIGVVLRGMSRPQPEDGAAQQLSSHPAVAVAGEPSTPGDATVEQSGGADNAAAAPSAELPAAAMAAIRDNTYFRTAEKDAWFELISKLQRTPSAELAARSMGEVGYAQLSQQPDAYRAKVVTVRGTVRQATEETPADNDIGLKSYYRLVFQPDGGEMWPIFVYALELPADFPRGEKVSVEAVATGYFFKNLSYRWQDGIGIAPVVLARDVTRIEPSAAITAPGPSAQAPPLAAELPLKNEAGPGANAVAKPEVADLSELLSLAGWGAERWATFVDDKPLTAEQRQELVQLLWRLRTFDIVSIAAWTRTDISPAAVAAQPSEYRGQFLRFHGRLRRLTAHALPVSEAERLEMPRYFQCEIVVDNGAGTVTVLTPHVPQSWITAAGSPSLDEPATVAGLFVQMLPAQDGRPNLLLVARQVAADSLGRSALAALGMDVGLLDGIRNHQGIPGSERDAFYHLLAAVGQVGANQLIRAAQQNLAAIAGQWGADLKSDNTAQRQLAEVVTQRAADGRFSVAPLFNDADRQIGQLIVVDGIARRIVRVDANPKSAAADANDVARRLGIGHYYEIDVFTEDSQDRPLVFCVRELPAGLPTGDNLREPIRIAGFFFKSWRYRTRDAGAESGGAGADVLGRRLIAPLLIGRGPVRIELAAGGGQIAGLIAGGLFVLALLGIWGAAWWFARGDRRFRQQTAAARYTLPPGESLDELNVPAAGEPMNIAGPPFSDPRQLP